MSYNKDRQFSTHKDGLLKPVWGDNSFEHRFVLAGSYLLQKTHGLDVLLQLSDEADYKIDTKHVRGKYSKFYLEEMSCPAFHTLGWLLKDNPTEWPDLIGYCFWSRCWNCYGTCNVCPLSPFPTHAYFIPFRPLRAWFIANKHKYELHTNESTINQTTGRKVPIADVYKAVGYRYALVTSGSISYTLEGKII